MQSHLSPPPADRIWLSQSFNVGTAGAKVFSGPAAEEFGYTVQQATNHEGKWYEVVVLSHHLRILFNERRVIFLASITPSVYILSVMLIIGYNHVLFFKT